MKQTEYRKRLENGLVNFTSQLGLAMYMRVGQTIKNLTGM